MKTHPVPDSSWLLGMAVGAAIVLCAEPVTGQQSDASRPSLTVNERAEAYVPEPLANDLGGLRRQARALQRELADRDKDMAKLQRALSDARQDLVESSEASAQMKTRMNDALDREKDALSAARRHEKALEQALQDAQTVRQRLDATEEELKTQQAVVAEATRETEVLKELLTLRNEVAARPVEASKGAVSDLQVEAHRLLMEGQIEEAADRFRQGSARWPENLAYPIGLASCHYAAGKLPLAKALLEDVLDKDADQAEAQGLLGLVLWQEDDLRQAERRLSRAVRGQPDNERWQIYLGMVKYARGRTGDARDAFEKAIRINPMNPEAQFNLAILLAGDDRPDLIKARVHYEQALRLGTPADEELEKLIYRR